VKAPEPLMITAITERGLRANVSFRFDGFQYVHIYDPIIRRQRVEKFRRYRVFIEVPWEYTHIQRIAVVGWPDDVTLIFDVPGLSEDEARDWAQRIDIREVAPPIGTLGTPNDKGDTK